MNGFLSGLWQTLAVNIGSCLCMPDDYPRIITVFNNVFSSMPCAPQCDVEVGILWPSSFLPNKLLFITIGVLVRDCNFRLVAAVIHLHKCSSRYEPIRAVWLSVEMHHVLLPSSVPPSKRRFMNNGCAVNGRGMIKSLYLELPCMLQT